METTRNIRKVLKAKPTLEGAGVHLKRVFGFSEVPMFDPFLLLDDFRNDRPEHYLKGFPWHPHRGIETITYVLTGDVQHGDSMKSSDISGVFSSMYWAASIRDIPDGTANTIAVGEIRPDCSLHLWSGWLHVNSFWIGTTGEINYPTCPGEPGYDRASTCNHEYAWGKAQAFRSRHPGGAQFCFADGSVHFLGEDIDYVTYQKLGDRRDGYPIGEIP